MIPYKQWRFQYARIPTRGDFIVLLPPTLFWCVNNYTIMFCASFHSPPIFEETASTLPQEPVPTLFSFCSIGLMFIHPIYILVHCIMSTIRISLSHHQRKPGNCYKDRIIYCPKEKSGMTILSTLNNLSVVKHAVIGFKTESMFSLTS